MASGIVEASLVADRDRVVAIVVEASLVQLAAAVDIVCTVDSLVVCIVVVVGLIVVEASLVVTAVEDSSVADNIVGVASLVDRLAAVAAVADLDHNTTLMFFSLFYEHSTHFGVLNCTTINAQNVTSDEKEALYIPCKKIIAIQAYKQN